MQRAWTLSLLAGLGSPLAPAIAEWWTNAQDTTNGQGAYQTRGFLGDYDVTVSSGGKSQVIKTQLSREG